MTKKSDSLLALLKGDRIDKEEKIKWLDWAVWPVHVDSKQWGLRIIIFFYRPSLGFLKTNQVFFKKICSLLTWFNTSRSWETVVPSLVWIVLH